MKNLRRILATAAAAVFMVNALTAECLAQSAPRNPYPRPEGLPPETASADAKPPAPILSGHNADPAIRVFGDTYYIYPTSDKDQWLTTDFSVWSSKNLVDWKWEGMILDVTHDLSWANIKAWAPDCIERNGTYYFYFCAVGKPLLERHGRNDTRITSNTIDPYPLIDDDGQAYLYWGNSSGKVNVVKLKPDMITLEGDPMEFTIQ